jgi:hypothetical protein
MAKRNCLYATNDGQFFMARNKSEARDINPNAHAATDVEFRQFWIEKGLGGKPIRETCAELGVSHQTICNWYKRACAAPVVDGVDIAIEKMGRQKGTKQAAVVEAVRDGADIEAVSLQFGLAKATVIQYCRMAHLSLSKRGPKFNDEKILELANGRTWGELAEVTGRSIATLRNRIYRNKELALAVRNVMKLKFIKGSVSNERSE